MARAAAWHEPDRRPPPAHPPHQHRQRVSPQSGVQTPDGGDRAEAPCQVSCGRADGDRQGNAQSELEGSRAAAEFKQAGEPGDGISRYQDEQREQADGEEAARDVGEHEIVEGHRPLSWSRVRMARARGTRDNGGGLTGDSAKIYFLPARPKKRTRTTKWRPSSPRNCRNCGAPATLLTAVGLA